MSGSAGEHQGDGQGSGTAVCVRRRPGSGGVELEGATEGVVPVDGMGEAPQDVPDGGLGVVRQGCWAAAHPHDEVPAGDGVDVEGPPQG